MKRLFGAYRRDQFADPDGYIAQAAIVFAGYDDETLVAATDPRNRDAIQRTHKWPPSLAEMGEALDAAEDRIAGDRYMASRGYRWDDNLGRYLLSLGHD